MQDIYLSLRDFLDKMPGGFPTTETGIEIKILKKLFTPEQARITMQLRTTPEPVSAIAPRLGMIETQAAAVLESMVQQGLIYETRVNDQPFYSTLQFMVGIYEFQINTLDRELAELMEEYFPYLAKPWASTNTKQLRVVPIGSSISNATGVATYDQVRELVKGKKLFAVAPCICQKKKLLLGYSCDRPLDRCVLFDAYAQYFIDKRLARKISKDEFLDILKIGEEKALVLSFSNAKDVMNVCMCCKCCCEILGMLKKFPKPAEQTLSAFNAQIDPDLCTVCDTCTERCQMDAIMTGAEYYEINKNRCIGCGLCVTACPTEAITLKAKPNPPQIPDTISDMRERMAKERAVFFSRSLG